MGTSTRRLGAASILLVLAAAVAGCGDSGSAVPAPRTIAPTTAADAAPITTTGSTTTTLAEPAEADLVLDSHVDTIYDLDPGSGRWLAVQVATVAVRGRLAGRVEPQVELLGHPYETWRLRVAEQVLGAPVAGELLVAHRLEGESAWTTGGEAIYLLAPFVIAPGVTVPDLWVAKSEEDVIRSHLDEHAELLRAGGALLGSGLARQVMPDGWEALADARLVVEAGPGSEVGSGDVLGWEYTDAALADPGVAWTDVGRPPEPVVVRLAADEAGAWLETGDRRLLPLAGSSFEDRWRVAGGRLEVAADLLDGVEPGDVPALLDEAWAVVAGRRATAEELLIGVLDEIGRLPLPGEPFDLSTEPPAAAPAPPPVIEVDYLQPFTIDQGDLQIVFDQWWWATLDSSARVQVIRDGEVLVEGPLSGAGAVAWQDEASGDFTFVAADGTPMALLTVADLNAAIGARLDEIAAGDR